MQHLLTFFCLLLWILHFLTISVSLPATLLDTMTVKGG